MDLLAEVTALRELKTDIRSERSLTRAFHALLKTKQPLVVWVLVSVCAVIFLVGELDPETYETWKTGGWLTNDVSEPWRLFSYGFFHGNARHLIVNMLGLLLVGHVTEMVLGRKVFLAVYLGSMVGAGLASVVYKQSTDGVVPTIGASGAVAGIAAMALFLGIWFGGRYGRIPMRYTTGTLLGGAFLVTEMVLGATGNWDMIDHACHIGGLVFGLSAGLIAKPHLAKVADSKFGWSGSQPPKSRLFAAEAPNSPG